MKPFNYIFLVLIFSTILFSCSQEDKNSLIAKVNTSLNELDIIEYTATIQAFENEKEVFKDVSRWHFDFSNGDSLEQMKFTTSSEEGKLIFNGDSTFIAQPQIETVLLRDVEEICLPLQVSIYPFRKLLSEIMKNEDIAIQKEKDTIIDNKDYYRFNLHFKNKEIGENCTIDTIEDRNSKYTLVIDKKTYLPRQIILQKFKQKTTYLIFDDFRKTDKKSDDFWQGKELPKNYIRMDSKTLSESRQKQLNSYVGKKITSWEIPELNTQNRMNPYMMKGSVILLEFWFPNCPPCIEALPELNNIYGEYKDQNFLLFGIEYTNEKRERLFNYVNKEGVHYPILYNGKVIASSYKITAAPTIMIIDKKGTILYAKSGFNKKEVLKLIEENI